MNTENTPGNWNEKYGIMRFKANHGYHTAMKKIVDDYVRNIKIEDPEIIVIEDTNDDKVRSWVVGNPKSISKMVDDDLRKFGCI